MRGTVSSRQGSSREQNRSCGEARRKPASAPGISSRRQAPVCHFMEVKLLAREPRNNKIGLIE